jgi:hypothetical protein
VRFAQALIEIPEAIDLLHIDGIGRISASQIDSNFRNENVGAFHAL